MERAMTETAPELHAAESELAELEEEEEVVDGT